jgi:hypothetical protein
MNERRPRSSGMAPGVSLLGAGVTFVLGITGWASETPPDEASALFRTTELSVHMGSPGQTTGQAGLPGELYGDVDAGPALGEGAAGVQGSELQPSTPTDPFVRSRTGLSRAEPSSRSSVKRQEQSAPRLRNGPPADRPGEQLDILIAESGSEQRSAPSERTEAEEQTLPGGADADEQDLPSQAEDEGQAPASRADAELPASPSAAKPGQDRASGEAAPEIEVRVGNHGEYDRVVFEWPEEIEYEVVQRAEQVTLAFSRAGRIDLSPLRDGFGQRVVEAWTEGGQVTDRVVLRLAPDASVRTFRPDRDRIVAIDVYAETAAQSAASPAPEPDTIQALREALEQRDAVINDLVVRMEQLERKLALSSGELDTIEAGGAGAAGAVGSAPPAPATAQPPSPSQETVPEPAAASEGAGGEPADNAQGAPGEFDVAEEDIDRALERTLVQTGALLLPFGQAEVEPYFSYTRREDSNPAFFVESGFPALGDQQVSRNEFVTGQNLRVGLPFDSQVEFDLPYRYVDQSVTTPVGFNQRRFQDGSGQGLGDLRVGLAKTLVRENGGWWPDLVARVTWDTDTGETSDNEVGLDGSFHEVRGSLSAIKRQDPLAFVGGVSYEKSFENDDLEPGDELGFSIGTVLAASPGTSLRLALSQSFSDNVRVDGEGINGSDQVMGMATFGASVVLGRGVLLDVAADIGLTDDAPDYAARASLPIRFNLPVY